LRPISKARHPAPFLRAPADFPGKAQHQRLSGNPTEPNGFPGKAQHQRLSGNRAEPNGRAQQILPFLSAAIDVARRSRFNRQSKIFLVLLR